MNDINEKTPHAYMANWVLHNKTYLFYFSVLYTKDAYQANGKNISIHFTEHELTLLDEFEKFSTQNCINRSGWVKQHMMKALTENKRQLAFR